jgi:GntR family transcriptional regulator
MINAGTEKSFDTNGPIPAFRVEGVTFRGKEVILEMEDSTYRGEKYLVSVRAGPNAAVG